MHEMSIQMCSEILDIVISRFRRLAVSDSVGLCIAELLRRLMEKVGSDMMTKVIDSLSEIVDVYFGADSESMRCAGAVVLSAMIRSHPHRLGCSFISKLCVSLQMGAAEIRTSGDNSGVLRRSIALLRGHAIALSWCWRVLLEIEKGKYVNGSLVRTSVDTEMLLVYSFPRFSLNFVYHLFLHFSKF